jgi:uncharacterized protein YdaL
MHNLLRIRTSLLIFICLFLAIAFFVPKVSAESSPTTPHVLLVYDSLALGTEREGNIYALERILAAFGAQVTVISYDKYEAGTLDNYQKVITIGNADDIPVLPANFTRDMNAYNGENMHIGHGLPTNMQKALAIEELEANQDTVRLAMGDFSQSSISVSNMSYITKSQGKTYGQITSEKQKASFPYGVIQGKNAYIPYMVKGNLSEQAAAYVMKDWLSVTTPSQYYLLLNEINPFSDLEMLNETADRLYEAGIPFIASVQPILNKLDYPATQRYLESLKHLQSRNGSIVVNTPVVASTISQDITVLKTQMSAFLDALAQYNILPTAVGTEMYWTYDQHYSTNGLAFFDSGILFPNKRLMYRAQTNTSSVFTSPVYTIQADELDKFTVGTKILKPFPMNTAIVYPFPEDRIALEAMLDKMISNWTTFADYKNEFHQVRTGKNEMSSRSGHLQINGKAIILNNNFQEIDSEHTYVEETKASLTTLFSVQNKIFIILILSTLLVFMAFLIIGYRMYRRKFIISG